MHTGSSRCEFNMLMVQGWVSTHKNPKGKAKNLPVLVVKVVFCGGASRAALGSVRAVMPEKPQVQQVGLTGMVTWNIQPPAEHL